MDKLNAILEQIPTGTLRAMVRQAALAFGRDVVEYQAGLAKCRDCSDRPSCADALFEAAACDLAASAIMVLGSEPDSSSDRSSNRAESQADGAEVTAALDRIFGRL